MEKKGKLYLNASMNVIKGIMSVLFPLITFPYISRVLGVEQLGRYNFVNSIISYFILIAGLGVNAYAIREGAKVREDKSKFSEFANEIFSINIISTVLSYCLLFFAWFVSHKLKDYNTLLIIMSFSILLQTLGVEWIYSVYEEFSFLALRSIIFQFIALVAMFAFVHRPSDVDIYAIVVVLSTYGANIINLIFSRKYCKLGLSIKKNGKRHLRPILVMFATAVTIIVYVSSDTTILGYICGDVSVGLYSVSVKVYTIIKTVISSLLIVFIPRISLGISKNDNDEINFIMTEMSNLLITVIAPIILGVICFSEEIIYLIAGEEFLAAGLSLNLLAIALMFSMGAFYWGQCVMIPFKQESKLFYITVISAVVNVVLNFALIPKLQQNGAAFTTIIAEAIALIGCYFYGKKYVKISEFRNSLIKVCTGCLSIIIISVLTKLFVPNMILRLIIAVVGSAICYFVIEVFVKNTIILSVVRLLSKRGAINEN